MKKLHFDYNMNISFEGPATDNNFSLKCVPSSDEYQHIVDLEYNVQPADFVSESRDSLGNIILYGRKSAVHSSINVSVTGTARVGISPCRKVVKPQLLGLMAFQSGLTVPGETIIKYHDDNKPDVLGRDNLAAAIHYMDCIYGDLKYKQGVTDVSTTAEEALKLGMGVCQDYAHILISLCRMDKIPARYVVGMLIGEGQSHAWVEIEHNGAWYQLDPTNHKIVEDEHIKISHGRDYGDCIVNKGIFSGNGSQSQIISVIVRDRS